MRTVVITGAARGIGRALALEYAGVGTRLHLMSRNRDRLEAVAAACREKGAEAHTHAIDVTDGPAMEAALAAIDAATPVDIIIANAGVSSGRDPKDAAERTAAARHVMRVNMEGVVNTLAPLVEPMRARGAGRMAVVASIAGLLPLPDSPAYCASKAGAVAYARALDLFLRPSGVSVTALCPGFVVSDMSARFSGTKPFMLSAEDAARRMARAVDKRRRVYAFPAPMALAVRAANVLPVPLLAAILARASRFTIRAENE